MLTLNICEVISCCCNLVYCCNLFFGLDQWKLELPGTVSCSLMLFSVTWMKIMTLIIWIVVEN